MKRLKGPLLGISVMLVMLIMFDVAIRLAMPIPGIGYGAWGAFPHSKLSLISRPDGLKAEHRYNKCGFRGADFNIERTTAHRLACIGDSYTEGIGAEEGESWPGTLGQMLAPRDCEALNLGDPGSAPERYAEILCKVAIPLHATDALICVNTNDMRYGPHVPAGYHPAPTLPDPFHERRSRMLKPLASVMPGMMYLMDRAKGRYPIQHGNFWQRWEEEDYEAAIQHVELTDHLSYCRAEKEVNGRLHGVTPGIIDAARAGEFNPGLVEAELTTPFLHYQVTTTEMGIAETDLAECTHSWVEWYAHTCEEQHVRPWIVYFPTAALVQDASWGIFDENTLAGRPHHAGDTSIRDLLKSECDAMHVRFVDATEPLLAHKDEKLYWRYDTHPTAGAYRIVAEAIASAYEQLLHDEPEGSRPRVMADHVSSSK